MVNTKKVKEALCKTNAEIAKAKNQQESENSQLHLSLLNFLGNTCNHQGHNSTDARVQDATTNATVETNWTCVKNRDEGYKPCQIQKMMVM
jgi:hypothetical protein